MTLCKNRFIMWATVLSGHWLKSHERSCRRTQVLWLKEKNSQLNLREPFIEQQDMKCSLIIISHQLNTAENHNLVYVDQKTTRGPITIKPVTRLIAHGLLSDSAPLLSAHVVALDLVTLHYAHVCLCACVRVCVRCRHSTEHTLLTFTDGLLRNSASRLGL